MPEQTAAPKTKTGRQKPKKVAVYLPSLSAARKLEQFIRTMPGENEAIRAAIKEGIKRVEGRRGK